MYMVVRPEEVNNIFLKTEPKFRNQKECIEMCYPEAKVDANGRYHSPCDYYEYMGKNFMAGEYLPFDDEEYRIYPEGIHPEALTEDGVKYSWNGTKTQNRAVWEELKEQNLEFYRTNSAFVGNVGDKVIFDNIRVMRIISIDSYYGLMYIYLMKDIFNNFIVYKGAKHIANEDEIISMYGKVKLHNMRDGIAQTIIERPKII